MNTLQGKRVLVLGLGLSGLALARWCQRWGAEVTVADTRQAPPQLEGLREHCPQARFVAGPLSAELVSGQQAVFKSPGLSPTETASVVDAARAMGLHVGNELSLFARALADLAQPQTDRRGRQKLVIAEPQGGHLPVGPGRCLVGAHGDEMRADLIRERGQQGGGIHQNSTSKV